MDSRAEISVVVPTRNAERFVEACLDTVRAQTLPPVEIVVCDDDSEDRTREVVEKVARTDSRVKLLVHDRRQGISKNFNSGIQASRGRYVTLIAGDDLWGPRKLEQEVRALRHTGRRWAYSKADYANAEGGGRSLAANTARGLEGDVLRAVLLRELAPRSPLIERALLDEIGLFDPRFAVFEDWDLRIRLAAAADAAHAPGREVVYRLHPAGSSKSRLPLRMEMALAVIERHRATIAAFGDVFQERMRQVHGDFFAERIRVELAEGRLHAPDETLLCRTLLLALRAELTPSSAVPAPLSEATHCTG